MAKTINQNTVRYISIFIKDDTHAYKLQIKKIIMLL